MPGEGVGLKDYHSASRVQRFSVQQIFGDKDGLKVDATRLYEVFDQYGLQNSFEIYHGNPYECGGKSPSKPRDAVFQQEPLP